MSSVINKNGKLYDICFYNNSKSASEQMGEGVCCIMLMSASCISTLIENGQEPISMGKYQGIMYFRLSCPAFPPVSNLYEISIDSKIAYYMSMFCIQYKRLYMYKII